MLQGSVIENPGKKLRQAAAEGDINKVKTFLEEKYINSTSSNGNTALHWSIERKKYTVTKLLLSILGIQLDIANHLGYTPLHLAAKQSDKKTIYRLLRYGAGNKNHIDKEGFSPLDYAFAQGDSFIATKLKQTLPHMALKDEDKLAEQTYEKFKTNNPDLIRNAQIFDHNYFFKDEVARYFQPGNLFKLGDLQQAIIEGTLKPHKLFCAGNLLQSAVLSRVDTLKKIRWLLKQGVDPNLQASHEINPASYKNTALHTLIANENEKNALEFIDLIANYSNQKFNFNLTDSEGKTCLCLAVKIGLSEVAKKLSRLTDVNIPDEDGNTPLHYAFLLGHASMVKELINHQSDRNAKNKENRTPYELLNSTDSEDVRDCLETIWIDPDRKVRNTKKTCIQLCMKNRKMMINQYKDMANLKRDSVSSQEIPISNETGEHNNASSKSLR